MKPMMRKTMRFIFILLTCLYLTGCVSQIFSVLPKDTDVCPQGQDGITGQCW